MFLFVYSLEKHCCLIMKLSTFQHQDWPRVEASGMAGWSHRTSYGKKDEEGNHQTEEPQGPRQGKAQIGIVEKLLLETGVPGIANNQATKHCSNASPWSIHTKCGSPSNNTQLLCQCPENNGKNIGLEFLSGPMERGADAGRLFRWDLWSIQERSRHRVD